MGLRPVSRDVRYVNSQRASEERERRRGERTTPWKWTYVGAGDRALVQVKYSARSTAQRYVFVLPSYPYASSPLSPSSFLPRSIFHPVPRILRWAVLPSFRSSARIRPSSGNFKSQRCAMNFLLAVLAALTRPTPGRRVRICV